MIITLQGADFSLSNIGTLNTWRITRVLGAGATYEGASSVDKNAAYTATVTLATDYEVGAAGITITMGGVALTDAYTINGQVITISIASVTGNIYINIPTVNTAEPEVTYYTVTYKYQASGTDIATSTTEQVAAGTYMTFSTSNAATVNGYTVSSVSPTSATVNSDITVIYNYEPAVTETVWYVDHRNNVSAFTTGANIAGRGWAHATDSNAYAAYVGKPVNTIGFFTSRSEAQSVTIWVGPENGTEADGTIIGTFTSTATETNVSGKYFATVTFTDVTLTDGQVLGAFTSTNSDIHFLYNGSNPNTVDANGIKGDGFWSRVPTVYGSGNAWTNAKAYGLGWSIGYVVS